MALLPFIATAIFALWLSSPLWGQTDMLFMGRLSGDNLASVWFYDFVANSTQSGDIQFLSPFDYPDPLETKTEFPNVVDAKLLAPFNYIYDVPSFWGVSLSVIVLFNSLSLSFFAKSMQCSNVGVFVAGCFGALMRPMWSDLAFGRMNVCFIGFALIALGSCVLLVTSSAYTKKKIAAISLVAVTSGSIAALIYPPFLILLIPFYPTILLWRYSEIRLKRFWLPMTCVILALLLSLDDLLQMVNTHYREVNCNPIDCPDAYHHIDKSNLFLRAGEDGLSTQGLSLWPLFLVPFVFVNPNWRYFVPLPILTGLYLIMGLGPCPQGSQGDVFSTSLHCWGLQLQDFGRFGTIAAPFLILLAAKGCDVFLRLKDKPKKGAYVALGVVLAMATSDRLVEIQSPKKWHRWSPSVIGSFLNEHPNAVVVELPFDRSGQFISALTARNVRRVNPLKLERRRQLRWQFFKWVDSLGRLDLNENVPSSQQIEGSNVDWVFYDPNRCPVGLTRCRQGLPVLLEKNLGVPLELDQGVLAWDISKSN